MPPDHPSGGRDRHVRDVTAPGFFQNPSSTVFVNFPTSTSPITPDSTPPTSHSLAVKSIMSKTDHTNGSVDLLPSYHSSTRSIYPDHPNTPPLLTPRSSSDSLADLAKPASRHAHTILDLVFPCGPTDLQAVHDISAQLPAGLDGAILDRTAGSRSVYIHGLASDRASAQHLRDLVVRVLELADEHLEADEVVFVLEKDHPKLRELLQGLLYVGGSVIRNEAQGCAVNPALVLVGIEI